MIQIVLKNGDRKEYDSPVSAWQVANDISPSLAKSACAAEMNGKTADLRTRITQDCTLSILCFADREGKAAYRHTAAHILAQAVKRLYPETQLAIGPSVENGFYYDFEFAEPFSQEQLPAVEQEMKKIIKEALAVTRFTLSRKEALAFMEERGEAYKVQLIQELPQDAEISLYQQGEFIDLCAGPHLMNTRQIKAFQLLSVAGAYWKGSQNQGMLTRIYGTAFDKNSDLQAYLQQVEEAKKRDHRVLGKELGLFAILDEGPGFPFFFPKGMILKNLLLQYWRELHQREHYQEISTPIMLDQKLWVTSGHWEHYQENMYQTKIEDREFAIKPMNCPGGMLYYKSSPHSYRELPLRIGELGLVHRHERSGALHGLMRVRCFTQDDAHIFMTQEQVTGEIIHVIRLIDEVYHKFGFQYHAELSTMPEDHIGTEAEWEAATEALQNALEQRDMDYVINPGDGAFYGPKIDFHLQDSLGRSWQCGTIQLDFQLPRRFEAEYIGDDGEKHRPVLIHRVIFGSVERFLAILTEHFAGKFPLWLSPVQVKLLSVSAQSLPYAESILQKLEELGFRCTLDSRGETIGYKIREAQLERVPYMLVIGALEAENKTLSVRSRDTGTLGTMDFSGFVAWLREEQRKDSGFSKQI